jgi:hypothetical protein
VSLLIHESKVLHLLNHFQLFSHKLSIQPHPQVFARGLQIRMAGYSATDPASNGGFVQNFGSFGSPHDTSGATNDANNIAFTVDNDDSGAIETTTNFELIAYRRDGGSNTLERWDAVSG